VFDFVLEVDLSVSSKRGKLTLSIFRDKCLLPAHLGQLFCFLLVDFLANDFLLIGFSFISYALCILDQFLSLFFLELFW
jgi:hypothetical protein